MRIAKKERDKIPLCIMGRKNHAWKLGVKIFRESHICGKCGYDILEDVHKKVEE